MVKLIYTFRDGKAEGDASRVATLGGKGAHLAEMSKLGLPVPAGFTIPTMLCRDYAKDPVATMGLLMPQVIAAYEEMCHVADNDYLLVSVRSGAPVSMPGMMDTILNVGMVSEAVGKWAIRFGDNANGDRAALDCRRRLIQMLGDTAYGIPSKTFEALLTQARFKAHVKDDSELQSFHLDQLCKDYEKAFIEATGKDFPDTVGEQLTAAVEAVFKSWNNERAKTYRKLNGIDDAMGTAVTVQTMVFGNLNDNSGSGVLFTRHPSTGAKAIMGEFLPNAQGEDVVAGIRTPLPLSKLAEKWPAIAQEIGVLCGMLEVHYKDMMDLEFTVQDGKLFILQCRAGKRSSLAKLQIAHDLIKDGVIDLDTALSRFHRSDVRRVLQPQIDPGFKTDPDYEGIGSTQGVAVGVAVLTAEAAIHSTVPCILVRHETDPDDIGGMAVAAGILTMTGGATSHAAVVARAMNKPAVVGCTSLPAELSRLEGKQVTIDGATGKVWVGVNVPVIDASKAPVVIDLASMVAARAGVRMELPVDQFIGSNVSCQVLVPDALNCTPEQAHQPHWAGVLCDLRTDRAPKDPDGLGDLFALSQSETTPTVNGEVIYSLRDRGATFAANGMLVQSLKHAHCTVEGPAETINEALDRKTLEVTAAVVAKMGAETWSKLMTVLQGAGFTKSSVTAAPPAYILMKATTEG